MRRLLRLRAEDAKAAALLPFAVLMLLLDPHGLALACVGLLLFFGCW